MPLPHKPNHLTNQERRYLASPAILAGLCLAALMILEGLTGTQTPAQRQVEIGVGLVIMVYGILFLKWVLPVLEKKPWIGWLLVVIGGWGIGQLTALDLTNATLMPALFLIVVVSVTAILQGRLPAYVLVMLSTVVMVLLSPFRTPDDIPISELATFPLIGLIITETVLRLQTVIYTHLNRLQTLNNVARSLASSLEIHQVTALVSSAIQNALDADTYYVTLIEGDHLRLELFYDDGEFFPPAEIEMEGTLAGAVVRSKQSIYIRDLIKQASSFGVKLSTVGKPRLNASWMGTPLDSGGSLVGMIGAASYHKNAFTPGDLSLLESIAQQAALAIVNANHHAEVERQSQLDSLTGVYNHGCFLKKLADAAELMQVQNAPLSLIMLDIDFFKKYNDLYGHMVGDQVLTAICKTVQANIKATDLVGRWGGEEFIIALLNTNWEQAYMVARRIQAALAAMQITDRVNQPVALPTISQGLAQYPDDVDDIYKLIDLADQRLYVAKERGRNQIEFQLGASIQRTQPRQPVGVASSPVLD